MRAIGAESRNLSVKRVSAIPGDHSASAIEQISLGAFHAKSSYPKLIGEILHDGFDMPHSYLREFPRFKHDDLYRSCAIHLAIGIYSFEGLDDPQSISAERRSEVAKSFYAKVLFSEKSRWGRSQTPLDKMLDLTTLIDEVNKLLNLEHLYLSRSIVGSKTDAAVLDRPDTKRRRIVGPEMKAD